MHTKKVAGRIYNFEYCIGGSTPGGKGFFYPTDCAVGPSGSVYVVNRGNMNGPHQGLTKCTMNHDLIWEDRGLNFGKRECRWPRGIALDSDENVYVTDDYTSQIFIYNQDGEFLAKWGAKGSGDGELHSPGGIDFDSNDNLFVVDSLNHRVQKFTREGRFIRGWGGHGSGEGEFNFPWGTGIDQDDNLYVADWKNNRVQKFSPEGEYLATFGGPGTGKGELKIPSDVAIDEEGDVYVIDWGNERLNIYGPDGAFLTEFVGDAERLSPWAQDVINANPDYLKARRRADLSVERWFKRPVAVKVNADGRIIVLETTRNRIQVYAKERDFVDAQVNL